jgi:hypothetical protein
MHPEWTPRQRQLRNTALATLSALLVDLVLIRVYGEVSGPVWTLFVVVGICLMGAVAITSLVLVAFDHLSKKELGPLG